MSARLDRGERRRRRLLEPAFYARYLDPVAITGEVLAGSIMALSFTLGGSLLVKERFASTHKMMLGVLGCNVAWGIIDGTMVLMSRMLELSRKSRLREAIREDHGGDHAVEIVAHELGDQIDPLTSPNEREQIYRRIATRLAELEPQPIRLKKEDFYAALTTCGVMTATTIPALAPFLLLSDRRVALRVSSLLLLTLLFLSGYRWGRITRINPWIFGSAVLLLGLVMVAVSLWLEP